MDSDTYQIANHWYHNNIASLVEALGDRLTKAFPPTPEGNVYLFPKGQTLEVVTYLFTEILSELTQAYLNAGSEKDVFLEDVAPAIEAFCKNYSK